MVTPRKHESARLNILKAWNAALIAQTGELMIDYQDISLVNETKYNEFRVSGYNPDAPFAPPTSIQVGEEHDGVLLWDFIRRRASPTTVVGAGSGAIAPNSSNTSSSEIEEEQVEVRKFFLVKYVKEDDGELSIIGTFVQSLFNLQTTISSNDGDEEELSRKMFFDYRFNDLTANDDNGWATFRRVELSKGRKTLQVCAPLDIETQYDRFPFKTIRASVLIELSSSAWGDKRRRPTLLLHKTDKAQNVSLQMPLAQNVGKMNGKKLEEPLMKKVDKSPTYDFISPYPEVTYMYENEDKKDKKKNYCSKFQVSFYMVESGVTKFLQIVLPMILIAVLNTLQVLGNNTVDGSDYLNNASTFTLAAIFMLPSIRTKRNIETVFCMNNFYILCIFLGLSLSSIPEDIVGTNIPAMSGMVITWLSFIAPISGSIGYAKHKYDILREAPKSDDRRKPSERSDDRNDLVSVTDVVEMDSGPDASIEYKCESFKKYTMVHS